MSPKSTFQSSHHCRACSDWHVKQPGKAFCSSVAWSCIFPSSTTSYCGCLVIKDLMGSSVTGGKGSLLSITWVWRLWFWGPALPSGHRACGGCQISDSYSGHLYWPQQAGWIFCLFPLVCLSGLKCSGLMKPPLAVRAQSPLRYPAPFITLAYPSF